MMLPYWWSFGSKGVSKETKHQINENLMFCRFFMFMQSQVTGLTKKIVRLTFRADVMDFGCVPTK